MSVLQELKGLDYEEVAAELEDFIRVHVETFDRDGIILGLSGGVDSATVATLGVRALGEDRVFALILPERDSEPENIKDAVSLADSLGIEYEVINITPILREFGIYNLITDESAKNKEYWASVFDAVRSRGIYTNHIVGIGLPSRRSGFSLAFVVPKVRTRASLIHYYSFLKNLLVTGTVNKTEYTIGTYDKHGDGACEIAPLRHLYKTQIKELARRLGVPKKIIDKPSTPDLFAGSLLTVEYMVGMPLEQLDAILYCLEKGMPPDEIASALNVDENVVKETMLVIPTQEVIRSMPIVPKPPT